MHTMKHDETRGTLDEISVREIACEAQVDPRSVRKALAGRRVRGVAGVRIRRVLAKRKVSTSRA